MCSAITLKIIGAMLIWARSLGCLDFENSGKDSVVNMIDSRVAVALPDDGGQATGSEGGSPSLDAQTELKFSGKSEAIYVYFPTWSSAGDCKGCGARILVHGCSTRVEAYI